MNNFIDVKEFFQNYRLKKSILDAKKRLWQEMCCNHTNDADMAAAEVDLMAAENAAAACREEIEQYINLLSDEEQQIILRARYICLKPWNKIANIVGYSTRYTLKLHQRALEQLSILCKQASVIQGGQGDE